MSHICSINGYLKRDEIAAGHIAPILISRNILPLLWLTLFTPKDKIELPSDHDGEKYPYMYVSASTAVKNISKVLEIIEDKFPDKQIAPLLRKLALSLKGIPYKYLLMDDTEIHFDQSSEKYLEERSTEIERVRAGDFDDWCALIQKRDGLLFDSESREFVFKGSGNGFQASDPETALLGTVEQDWTFLASLQSNAPTIPMSDAVIASYMTDEARQTAPRISGVQALIPGQKLLTRPQWELLIRMSHSQMKDKKFLWEPSAEGHYEKSRLKQLDSAGSKINISFATARATPHGALYDIQNPPLETSSLYRAAVKVLEMFPGAVLDRYGNQ